MIAAVNDYIDTDLKFRTYKKLKQPVQRQFPTLTDKDVKDIVNDRNHDIYIHRSKKDRRDYQRVYQVKIFSRHRGSWFGDLYDNLKGNDPRYWHVFINTNTRYAVAYPLQHKKEQDIHGSLQQFINDCHPKKLTHDEESGLVTQANEDLPKNNNCALFIVTERNHSTLGIIDRFIRTLRDMNTPQERPITDQSHHRQFSYISPSKMRKLLNSYNNTIHASTGHTPREMMDNPALEDAYIDECIAHSTIQMTNKNFKLKEGDLVRYIIHYNPHSKKRSVVSRETYKVEGARGNIYTIIATDGTTKNLPRWRLIKVNDDENHRMGTTLGTNRGVVESVLEEVSPTKIKVRFVMPDGSKYIDTINKRELRLPFPQFKSQYEN